MKTRYIIILAMVFIAGWAQAQSSDQNYVKTNVFRQELTVVPTSPDTSEAVQSIQYYDGLGRPIQTVVKQASPDGKDLVNQIGYDTYGRQDKTYLPFEASHTTPGNFHTNWENEIGTFYNDANNGVANEITYYYNETIYENSPLSRPVKAYGPGSAWRTADKYVSTVFDYNNTADAIPHFDVDTDATQTVTYTGLYADGELTKNVTYDEDGNRTEQFTDKLGRVITKKVQIDVSNDAITHYMYDDYGNLTFVIQPQGVIEGGPAWNTNLNNTTFRKNWMFRYKYDWRGQMIEKQVPGSEAVYMIYDRRGRVRMTQSGNERIAEIVTGDINVDQYVGKSYEIQGSGSVTLEPGFSVVASGTTEFEATTQGTVNEKWIVTKYDDANRPVMTGFYYTSDSKETLTSTIEQSLVYGETFTGSGPLEGYTNNVFPAITDENLLTVTYYDNYDFASDKANMIPSSAYDNPKGLVTGALTRILGEDQMLRSVSFYDDRGRSIKAVSQNHMNGADTVETTYRSNISSVVLQTVSDHTSDDYSGTLKVTQTFKYDHSDRMIGATHQIDNGPVVKLSETEYNAIGEVTQKKVGSSNGGTSFAQTLDYEFNIRGWLTKINDPITLSGGDRFGMELLYTGSGFYNGNIGKMAWKTDGLTAQDYTYTYDDIGRIESAVYNSSDNNLDSHFDVNNINYDANGNILSLNRFKSISGTKREIDRLSYNYGSTISNQLVGVADLSPEIATYKDEGFKDDGDNSDYSYDDNGNMVADANKDIVSINYNHLNLPELVIKGNGDFVKYIYDASGIKLGKVAKTSSNTKTTDYIVGKQYLDGSLSLLQHSEGRSRYAEGSFFYEYNLTDHLGNVRASVDESGNVVQRDDYYPFGLTFNSYNQSPKNNYQYNQGKIGEGEKKFDVERQAEIQLDLTKLRAYDYAIGRFVSVDPLADAAGQEIQTPYQYGLNNPILNNDPYGDCIGKIPCAHALKDIGESIVKIGEITGVNESGRMIGRGAKSLYDGTSNLLQKGEDLLKRWGNDRSGSGPAEDSNLEGLSLDGDRKGDGPAIAGATTGQVDVKMLQAAWGVGFAPGTPNGLGDIIKTAVSEGMNVIENANNTVKEVKNTKAGKSKAKGWAVEGYRKTDENGNVEILLNSNIEGDSTIFHSEEELDEYKKKN